MASVCYKGICYRTPWCLFNTNVKRKRFSWEIHSLRKLFLGIKLISHLMSWLVATRSDPYQPLITNPFHPQTGYTFVANSSVSRLWIKPLDSHRITLYRRLMFLFTAFNMHRTCALKEKTHTISLQDCWNLSFSKREVSPYKNERIFSYKGKWTSNSRWNQIL